MIMRKVQRASGVKMAMIKYNVCGDLNPVTGKRDGRSIYKTISLFQ